MKADLSVSRKSTWVIVPWFAGQNQNPLEETPIRRLLKGPERKRGVPSPMETLRTQTAEGDGPIHSGAFGAASTDHAPRPEVGLQLRRGRADMAVSQTVLGSHFGGLVNSPPILEPILVGIESDVHWGYDLDFDPWPHCYHLTLFGAALWADFGVAGR